MPQSADHMDRLIPLVFEDRWLLAANKPAGVVVIPGRDESPADSLRGQLEQARGETLWVVHRLDRETSGLVLFARDADSHRKLNQAFEQRRIHKQYWALAAGAPLPAQTRIELALHSARKGRMRPALAGEAGALSASTGLRVLQRWRVGTGEVAELELRPETGRQHQLRVHLRALEAPLWADPVYRLPPERMLRLPGAPLTRLALHAQFLDLSHPQTGERLQLQAPLAPDLLQMRSWLETQLQAP